MTATRRDPSHETPFGQWLKSEDDLDSIDWQLSITDADFWVHRYSVPDGARGTRAVDHLMLVEVKTFNAVPAFAQKDTLSLIEGMMRQLSVRRGRRRIVRMRDTRPRRQGKTRAVRLMGVHYLTLSGSRPDNSTSIKWDNKPIDIAHLKELLRFERDPDHPQFMLDTRRHHRVPSMEKDLPLIPPLVGWTSHAQRE